MRKRLTDPSAPVPEGKVLLSVEEAASVMSLGRSFIYELVMRREIASTKVGRVRRIPVMALQDFVDRQLLLNEREA
jgi:excisionase family DNA binding protein